LNIDDKENIMLKVGGCVSVRNIRHYSGKNWFEFKASKDKQMVFLYLGQEPKDGSELLRPDDVIKSMGWKFDKK